MRDITIRPEDYPDGLRLGAGRFGSGDTLSVREGVEWASETVAILGRPLGGSGFLGDLDMRIDGMVVAEGTAIDLWSQVSEVQDSDIRIGTAGLVGGVRNGIALKGGSGDEILNQGIVAGTRAAIAAGGDDLRIENTGIVLTFGNEIEEAPRYHAISITHGDATIRNEGAILGVDLGLRASEQAAIRVNSDATLELRNAATGFVGIENGTALWGGSKADEVINRGLIQGDVVLGPGKDTVTNHGAIGTWDFGSDLALGSGDDLAVNRGNIVGDLLAGRGDDLVRNSGVIEGVAHLGAGDDVVKNRGVLRGLDLGRGDDVYDDRGVGSTSRIAGGEGNDVYRVSEISLRVVEAPNQGRDTVYSSVNFHSYGEIERIVLTGSSGADAGGHDDDETIIGNDANNTLTGGKGRDRLEGEGGGDFLWGDWGKDVLVGGRGSDTLSGGKGGDVLIGGRGADTFIWWDANHAGISRTQRDVVRDFDADRDRARLLRPRPPFGGTAGFRASERRSAPTTTAATRCSRSMRTATRGRT